MKWNRDDWAHLLGRGAVVFPKDIVPTEELAMVIGLNIRGLWVQAPGQVVHVPWQDIKEALEGIREPRQDVTIGETIKHVTQRIGINSGHIKPLVHLRRKKDFLLACEAEEVQRG